MVVLVGDSYVGKSSLFQTFRHGELNALTTATITVEFYNVETKVLGEEVRVSSMNGLNHRVAVCPWV